MSVGALLFAACGLFFQALALGCAYESYAVATRKVPTISRVAAYHFANHPNTVSIGIGITFFILGALVTHFSNWKAVK